MISERTKADDRRQREKTKRKLKKRSEKRRGRIWLISTESIFRGDYNEIH